MCLGMLYCKVHFKILSFLEPNSNHAQTPCQTWHRPTQRLPTVRPRQSETEMLRYVFCIFHDGSMISSAATSFTQLYLCKGFNFVTGVRQGHEALPKMAKTQAEFTPKRNLSIYQPCIFRCELFRMCCGRGPAPWTTLLAAAGSFQEVVPWSGLPRTSRRSGRNGHLDWLAVLLHMKAGNLSMAGAFWPE